MAADSPKEVVSTVKRAAIASNTSGAVTVVSAVTGKKIRVLSACVIFGAATNICWKSNSTVIFGGSTHTMNIAANDGFILPKNEDGWMETVAGDPLILTTSSTGPHSGGITYQEIG